MAERCVSERVLRREWEDNSVNTSQIAERLGISYGYLWKLAKKYNLPSRSKRRTTPVDISRLRQLWGDMTVSGEDIGRMLGISRGHAMRLAKRYALPSRVEADKDRRAKNLPTPQEIAQRAAECRAKHLEEKRAAIWHSADDGARATVYVVRPGFIGTGTA